MPATGCPMATKATASVSCCMASSTISDDFASQVYFSGTIGHPTLNEPPTNATCRSLSYQKQSWKWVVGNTANRGTEPFAFNMKLVSMRRTHAYGSTVWGVKSGQEQVVRPLTVDRTEFTFDLPVPQRCKHIYGLTTDEIGDLAEFNNLMTALRNVSTNFNSLYNKLIRLDSEGNPVGRTGVTYAALQRMVGQKWYALANEVQGKKIAVEKTYKFYVKDEDGNKLDMVSYSNGTYSQVGTYLVIAPDGIRIENE